MLKRSSVVSAFHRISFRPSVASAAAFLLASCVTGTPPRNGIAKVNPASIAASPAAWDGRQVEIIGLLVWEDGSLGLYQDYGTYCRGAEQAAIYAHWPEWAGITKKDSRRFAVVRGIFRNHVGGKLPGGGTLIVAEAPGPGPLEPGVVVSWLSKPEKPCPNRS